MVTVILAIGAAVTTWSISLILPDLRLKAAVRDLKSDMNLARLRAVKENQVVSVKFDLANKTYTVFLDDGSTIKTVSLPKNVSWIKVTFSGDILKFNSIGRPLNLGSAGMVNTQPAYRGVTVNFTGIVTIKTSDDGSGDVDTWKSVD
jgi:Tfp pilus assembly protein FimT